MEDLHNGAELTRELNIRRFSGHLSPVWWSQKIETVPPIRSRLSGSGKPGF
jgi:hypothetical protein